jgi:hypothetical protein
VNVNVNVNENLHREQLTVLLGKNRRRQSCRWRICDDFGVFMRRREDKHRRVQVAKQGDVGRRANMFTEYTGKV